MEIFGGNGPKNSGAVIDDTASQKINLSKSNGISFTSKLYLST